MLRMDMGWHKGMEEHRTLALALPPTLHGGTGEELSGGDPMGGVPITY